MTYFHVTFTKHAARIRANGIKTFQTTNWIKAGDQSRYGDGSIYAFDTEYDAIRWAAKMDWDHHQKTGSGKISIVSFTPDPERWVDDIADPMSRVGSFGRWLKSHQGVKPTSITAVRTFTPEMAQQLVNEYSPYRRRL